jgi:hypothetical protein
MAVKVMVASAIAKGAARAEQARTAAPAEAARPRRRRSSVYDADGNEVFITLMCLKCHKMRPLSQFGLRKMADGAIRNQPWCRTCRSAAGTRGQGKGSAETGESSISQGPQLEPAVAAPGQVVDPRAEPAAEPPKASGQLSAQIAAALAAGLGR